MDAIIYTLPLSSCSSTPLELTIIFDIDVNSRYELLPIMTDGWYAIITMQLDA
jgi:hypothetical protein